jgi:hypothetical protein
MVYSQDLKHTSTYHHEYELDWEAQYICSRLQERSDLIYENTIRLNNRTMKEKIFSKLLVS